MAVAPGDSPVLVVNVQLGALPTAEGPTSLHSLLFEFVVAARPPSTAALDVPAPSRILGTT